MMMRQHEIHATVHAVLGESFFKTRDAHDDEVFRLRQSQSNTRLKLRILANGEFDGTACEDNITR